MNNLKTLATYEKLNNEFEKNMNLAIKRYNEMDDLEDNNKNTSSTQTKIDKLETKIFKIQTKIEEIENIISLIKINETVNIQESESVLKDRFNNIYKVQEIKIYSKSYCDYKIYTSKDTNRLLLIINNYDIDKAFIYSCSIEFLNEINKTAIQNIKRGLK